MTSSPDIPNLRHLRMLQVIGKLGGVSCASRELSTSQPAVTQAVANLEAEIGTPIFERHATGTFPTAAGKQFLLRIDRFFEILETAVHHVLGPVEQSTGRKLPPVERLITGTQVRSLIVTSEPARVAEISRQMKLSPASLFRSARTLERVLGKQLFDRSAHGPTPNKTGSYLARQFRTAIREIELAHGEVRLAAGEESLELVVGALPMSGSYELADAVCQFTEQCPAAKVSIVTGDYHGLLDDLRNSRIDMIFGVLRRPDWVTDVEEEAMFHDSYCIVTRPGHPLTKIRDIKPEHLPAYDWVVPPEGTPRRQRIEALFEGEETARPRFNVQTSSLSTSRALLLHSDMITVMTHREVRLDASLGNVESLPCRYLNALPPKGVTTRKDWLPTSAHTLFLDCLRKATSDGSEEEASQRPRIALVG